MFIKQIKMVFLELNPLPKITQLSTIYRYLYSVGGHAAARLHDIFNEMINQVTTEPSFKMSEALYKKPGILWICKSKIVKSIYIK